MNITSCIITRIIILLPELPRIVAEIVIVSKVIVIPASVVVVVIVVIAAAVVSIERRPMSIIVGASMLAIIPCKRHCACSKLMINGERDQENAVLEVETRFRSGFN